MPRCIDIRTFEAKDIFREESVHCEDGSGSDEDSVVRLLADRGPAKAWRRGEFCVSRRHCDGEVMMVRGGEVVEITVIALNTDDVC